MRIVIAALTLAWILGGTGEGQSRQAEQITRLGTVYASAETDANRREQCRFQSLDPGTWTQHEEDVTTWCVLNRWPVPGGIAKFRSVIDCESGWSRFAVNLGGPYVGLAQHALKAWADRVAQYRPRWWTLGLSWLNSRTQIVVTALMVRAQGWGPWACA